MKKIWISLVFVVVVGMIIWTAIDFIGTDDEADTGQDGALLTAEEPQQPDNDEPVETTDEEGIELGNIAPDFELENLEGEKVKLSDYRGEKVIVNFWATWCPPCRDEIPDFKELYEKEDVEILALNMGETVDKLDMVKEFVYDEFEMEFPVLKEESGDLMEEYNVFAFPTSYMIDPDGHIQYVRPGAMEYDEMKEQLDKMDE